MQFVWFLFLLPFVSQPLMGEARKNCGGEKHWVSGYTQSAYYRADGTFVRAHPVSAHCRKNPRGYKVWNQRIKQGRPKRWGYKKEKSTKWKTAEIERVLESLGELPKLLLDQNIRGIYRMMTSIGHKSAATTNVALGDTVLYDAAFDTQHNLAHVLAHELAHQLYDQLSDPMKRDYESKTLWENQAGKNRERWVAHRPKNQFVTPYAQLSPEEDLVSNIEYFLFSPSELKKKVPKAYAWIKKRFGDKLKLRKQK